MAQHALSLEVLDTLNPCILRIVDTSVYNSFINIDCPTLEITLPGFNYSIPLTSDVIIPGFSINITACILGLQTENCSSQFVNLPDGIYILRYSVSPNNIVFVEYNHLRMTQLLNKYDKVLCALDLANCAPDTETSKKLQTLHEVRMYLDAAKAKVEVCHEPDKGIELYSYAKKLLNKFECRSCH